jgi:hypothetical protein
VAAVLLALAAVAASPAPPPLTNEDIVRLVVHGTAEPVILREIAARPPKFDLDPGVIVELQQVGVSAAIIAAMRSRQIEAGGGAGAGAAAPPGGAAAGDGAASGSPPTPARTGQVVIRFRPPDKENDDPGPFAIAALPKQVTRPADAEVGTVSDLALVVLCTSSIHVPDHWESKTPLKGAPRHELLLFRPGSLPRHEHGFDLLALNREPVPPLTLEAGRHTLVVGLAGLHGSGDWKLIASDPEIIEIPVGGVVRLLLDARTKIRGNKMVGFGVDQVFTLSADPMAVQPAPEPPSDPAPTPDAAPPESRATSPGGAAR